MFINSEEKIFLIDYKRLLLNVKNGFRDMGYANKAHAHKNLFVSTGRIRRESYTELCLVFFTRVSNNYIIKCFSFHMTKTKVGKQGI